MSSNKKDFSASAVPVYSAQRGIRATDTKWLTAVQSSSGVETKDKTLQRACTLTTDKLEPAPRLLGPVDPWANFDEIRRNRNRKKKYALNPSIPSYLSANRQLRNYKWLPEKIWDADSWLNAMPKKFDDQPLAMGFDEVITPSDIK